MKLLNRLNKLITADAHAVLDSIEDPHALLKQALRDMSAAIEEDEQAIKQTVLNLEQLKQQNTLLQTELIKLNQDLDLCFESDNQELARSVVKKKLYLTQKITLNNKNTQNADEKLKQVQEQLADNQEEYLVISQQAEILLAQISSQAKKNELNQNVQFNKVISEDDVDMALLNEKAQREVS